MMTSRKCFLCLHQSKKKLTRSYSQSAVNTSALHIYMFDDIDTLCNSTQEEDRSYKLGIEDAKVDPDVKKQLADLGRENFTRGHNAGFACGLVIGALESFLENRSSSSSSSSSLEEEAKSIIDECKTSIVLKMKDLQEKHNDYQPETTYQKLADDDEEEQEQEEEAAQNELRNSFRVILVNVVEKFVIFWNKNNNKKIGEYSSSSSSSFPSPIPREQWQFLNDLVQDNKAGSPDNQTALSTLLDDHGAASPEEEETTTKNTATSDDNKSTVDGNKINKNTGDETAVAPKIRSRKPASGSNSNNNKPKAKKSLDEVLDW